MPPVDVVLILILSAESVYDDWHLCSKQSPVRKCAFTNGGIWGIRKIRGGLKLRFSNKRYLKLTMAVAVAVAVVGMATMVAEGHWPLAVQIIAPSLSFANIANDEHVEIVEGSAAALVL